MPQEPSRGGLDDAAEEEVKTFRTEGDGEERVIENGPASVQDSYGFGNPDDLNDVKSSLVIEGDPTSLKGANSQRNKRINGGETFEPPKDGHNKKIRTPSLHEGEKLDYPRFPPFTNLAFFPASYHGNGAVLAGPGGSKVPMVHPMAPYPPSLAHLMYNSDRYPPGTPPPAHLPSSVEIDSKTGILRPRHSLDLPSYHSLSPSTLGQLPPHLDVYPLSSQAFYPSIRSPYPTNLIVNSSGISRLAPSSLANPSNQLSFRGIPLSPQTSPASQHHDTQQQSNDREKGTDKKTEKKQSKVHIKKPLNAFMLYMKEMRASVVKECTLKESAAINQILGRRWHALSREEQAKYYELARKERQLHMQLYPGWSARDNYATACRRRKKRKDKSQGDASDPSTPKKCRARFGVDQQDFWCKPCRRKKKCIRFITDENDLRNSGDEEEDDSDFSGDEVENSKEQPPPSKKLCSNSTKIHSPDNKKESDRTLPEESSSPHHDEAKSNREGSRRPSSSSAASALSVSSLTAQPTRSIPPSSSGLSSVNSSCHPHSPAIMSHGSPTMIPLPHPATPSHPALSATSSFMVFPPHSPLLSYSSPSSIPDVYRGPPHLVPPPGLIPVAPLPGGPASMPHHIRLSSADIPQDLSMKSGTVTA
ncbi:Transcription factor 7-like 2 [Holothuria leucospilota]|uniref:Transcription factor 7-like 2 n=1 Tax=Holothuria leucospilota TaxID=206669 RepID=A0A9Q1BFP4_HOLLE|nr:Transcription factor 7-like 2 [Holothuria leucospilota]